MNVEYVIQKGKRKEKGPLLPVFFSGGRKKWPGKKDEEKSSHIVQQLKQHEKTICVASRVIIFFNTSSERNRQFFLFFSLALAEFILTFLKRNISQAQVQMFMCMIKYILFKDLPKIKALTFLLLPCPYLNTI